MSFLERLRALLWFLVAAAWFLFSDLAASRAANGLDAGDFQEPLYRIFLLFLLITGYWAMSRIGQRRMPSSKATALPLRPGWGREVALGAALGWAGVLACVLPAAVIGALVVIIFTNAHQYLVTFFDLIAIVAGSLALEITFRGYPFLRLVEAMGPVLGTFFMAVIYAIWSTHAAPTTTASVLVAFFLGCVLAVAVLRTRALWVGWGFHFAWITTMTMLFGLPVSGSLGYSPIIVTNTNGPAWITGSIQGPEGSAFAVLVSFILLFAMVRVTGDLKHKYGYQEIVPAGIPVDLDAAARAQHEAAMGESQPQQPSLVQILPAQPAVPPTHIEQIREGIPDPTPENVNPSPAEHNNSEPSSHQPLQEHEPEEIPPSPNEPL